MTKVNDVIEKVKSNDKQKTWTGTVVSDKCDKTIVVEIHSTKSHPIYKKKYLISKKFHVHDENNTHKVGEIVKFIETKPISKTKHHEVI